MVQVEVVCLVFLEVLCFLASASSSLSHLRHHREPRSVYAPGFSFSVATGPTHSFTAVDTPLYHYRVYAPAYGAAGVTHHPYYENIIPQSQLLAGGDVYAPYFSGHPVLNTSPISGYREFISPQDIYESVYPTYTNPNLHNSRYPHAETPYIPNPDIHPEDRYYAPSFKDHTLPPYHTTLLPPLNPPGSSVTFPSFSPNIIKGEAFEGSPPQSFYQSSPSYSLNSKVPSYRAPSPTLENDSTPGFIPSTPTLSPPPGTSVTFPPLSPNIIKGEAFEGSSPQSFYQSSPAYSLNSKVPPYRALSPTLENDSTPGFIPSTPTLSPPPGTSVTFPPLSPNIIKGEAFEGSPPQSFYQSSPSHSLNSQVPPYRALPPTLETDSTPYFIPSTTSNINRGEAPTDPATITYPVPQPPPSPIPPNAVYTYLNEGLEGPPSPHVPLFTSPTATPPRYDEYATHRIQAPDDVLAQPSVIYDAPGHNYP